MSNGLYGTGYQWLTAEELEAWDADTAYQGGTFFATDGNYESTDTTGWGGGGDMYTGQGWTQQQDWTWLPGIGWEAPTKEDVAQTTYDILDPYYGEGGILEPVTVVVDPDRTLKDEYGSELGLIAVAAVAVLALLK